MRETGTRPTDRQNERRKKSQTIYGPMLRVLSYVSLEGRAKNESVENI